MNLLIVIPSYNSNNTLSKLINSLNSEYSYSILVIDDGSSPSFLLDSPNLTVLKNIQNRGKGYSLLKGFSYASSKGYSHVLTMDADLQHNYLEVSKFIDYSPEVEFVLGYRERSNNMPILRRASNMITSAIVAFLTGVKIIDSQCGFRRYSLESVLDIDYIENGFQFESEVLIKCINKNSKIRQIKIETIYDKNNKSYIRHISDTLKFIRLIIRSIIKG